MRAIALLGLLACGDNAVLPDAFMIDAPPDTPTPPAGCSWGELFDTQNHTAPETTGLSFAAQLVFCGQIDLGHSVSTTMLVDSDAFGFSLTTAKTVRVELVGTGLSAFDRVEVAIVNEFGDPIATSQFVGEHAVVDAKLPVGKYGVAIRALGTEPAAAVKYTATIRADVVDCQATAAAAYTEQAEPNDVIEVRFTGDPAMRRVLTAAADAPEPTGLTLSATTRITGTSANLDAPDEFRDRDSYAITTGAGIDTLLVRLDWTQTTVDLDMLLFPENGIAELGGATHVSTTAPETATFAVAPSTTYWVWIGSYDSSTGLPITYDVSLCVE